MMYECIRPFQYVKEDASDYLLPRANRYFLITRHAGRVEISKKVFEQLEQKGMFVKWATKS